MTTSRVEDEPRLHAGSVAAWAAAAAAVLLVVLWSRELQPVLLWAAAVTALLAAALAFPLRKEPTVRLLAAAWVATALALAAGLRGEQRLARIEFDWARYVSEREERLASRLGAQMAALTNRGRRAAEEAAAQADAATPEELFARLDRVQRQIGVDALAVFGSDGRLIAWAGDHRGGIPDEIRSGRYTAFFAERPLYSYLYFTAPVKGRLLHAVAAVLVETGDLPSAPSDRALSNTFVAGTNVPAVFRSGAGHGPGIVWSLVAGTDTVAHARLAAVTQADARMLESLVSRRQVLAFAFVALLLLSIGWLKRSDVAGRRWASTLPLLALGVAASMAPLGAVLGLEGRASAIDFVLPIPGISLGDVVALVLVAAALFATVRPRRARGRAWAATLAIGAVATAFLYALALRYGIAASTPSLLQGGNGLWFGLQSAATLLLGSLTALLLPARRAAGEGRTRSVLLLVTALAFAALLGVFAHVYAYADRSAVPVLTLLWAFPLLLFAAATAEWTTATQRLVRWLSAGFMAATAVLPQLWGAHTDARLRYMERQLSTFGSETPAIVGYLLEAFADEAETRYAAGEDGLQLLYRSWVASGLAYEPYGVRITLWRDGEVESELGLGGAEGSDAASSVLRFFIEQNARTGEPVVGSMPGLPNVSTLLTVPLDSVRTISVTVQPRRTLQRTGAIAAFLGTGEELGARVTVIEQPIAPAAPDTGWVRTRAGWMRETRITYPEGPRHVHLEVDFTDLGMRLARATLLVTADTLLLLLLWVFGHAARGIPVITMQALTGWLSTFRVRVSLALFLFFLLPTALFGWLAYRGLSAVVRQAGLAIAARAAQQAIVDWPEMMGDLRQLAAHTQADVLRYLDGELIQASSPEGMALGVYAAWMSRDAYLALSNGEASTVSDVYRLEGQDYLTVYMPLQTAGTLGIPLALSVGDTASRKRDIAHLTLLAAVLGLLLSGVLSVAVGRALAGPIGRLQRAAAAVGAGRLSVRLPEPAAGEFGQLFASFNRMVRRLRRARAQEVRTARVLAWGEMAQQIAHEIKNPLTPIKLAVQHLRRAHRDGRSDFGKVLDENVEQILGEIDRLTEIARAFSRYGAPGPDAGPLTDVDVASVVHEAITLYRAGETNVRWEEQIEPALPRGRARSDELREVLMNLLENARDAVTDRGRVVVSVRRVDGRIELGVTDDGPGIPPELVPRIFDPHFSTRSSGTGLGLAIVRRLVESWGGTVSVDSRPGSGTTFRVHIMPAPDGGHGHGDGDGAAAPRPGAQRTR